jgi:hypothetical protein
MSALDGDKRLSSRCGSFTSSERAPITRWIVGWVDLVAVVGAVKESLLPLLGMELRPLSPSLYRQRDWETRTYTWVARSVGLLRQQAASGTGSRDARYRWQMNSFMALRDVLNPIDFAVSTRIFSYIINTLYPGQKPFLLLYDYQDIRLGVYETM